MLRFLIVLALIASVNATITISTQNRYWEIPTPTQLSNEFYYGTTFMNVSLHCHLIPDNSCCDYIPPHLQCWNDMCKGVMIPGLKLISVDITYSATELNDLSISEFNHRYPNLRRDTAKIRELSINYTVENNSKDPVCDQQNWDNYRYYGIWMLVGSMIALFVVVTLVLHPERIIFLGCLMILGVALVIRGGLCNCTNPCQITVPFNHNLN